MQEGELLFLHRPSEPDRRSRVQGGMVMSLTPRIDVSLCSERASATDRPHGPLHILTQIGRAFAREVRARRGLREIGSLDEAMLRDIGIGPGELEDVVRHGRGREIAPMTGGFDPKPSRDRVFGWTDWH